MTELNTRRQLEMYQQLLTGKTLNKTDLAAHYGVDPRSIQRDFQALKAFVTVANPYQTLTYHRARGGYQLTTDQHELSAREIIVIAKVLLASRAFAKQELDSMLDGLLRLIKPAEQKTVLPIIKNERFFYQPVHHDQPLLTLLTDLSHAIEHQTTLQLTYHRSDNQVVQRTVLPAALIFSEYYFYVAAYNAKYQTTLFYRADRIQAYRPADTVIQRTRAKRFEDGQFRQRIQFMYPGQLLTLTFQFWGIVEAALDRLPTAKVIQRFHADGAAEPIKNEQHRNQQPAAGGSVVITAEVYGARGITMWLLSQGANVKVLAPASLVTSFKQKLANIQAHYD